MAEPPAQSPSNEYPIHLRTGANIWAGLMVVLYCSALFGWLRPSNFLHALPSLNIYSLLRLAANIGFLACATGTTMAMGFAPGKVFAPWLGMPRLHAGRLIPLGWAVSGTAIMGLGLAGLWYKTAFALLALVSVAASLPALAGWMRTARPASLLPRRTVFLIPTVAVLWTLLLMLIAPEIFQDPLRYHLFIPQRFNLEHKWYFIDRYFFWSYIGSFHGLYGQALALGGTSAAKAVNLAAMMLNFAALMRITALLGIPDRYRPLLYTALITQPGLMLITGSVFVEHAMAVYILIAFESLLASRDAPFRALREVLLFLALGFNSKFTAVFGLAGILAALSVMNLRESWLSAGKRLWKPALAVGVAALAPWMAMRWLFTRDPVSPALAQLGISTMDLSSRIPLKYFYEFASDSLAGIIQSPDRLLAFPFNFSGGHEGFWEHPGPIIPALIPLTLLLFRNSSKAIKMALLFTTGSAIAWLFVAGGVSPHYVAAITPFWALSMVGALLAAGMQKWRIISGLLVFSIFFQSLISVVVIIKGWFPATVAMGELPVAYYLQRFHMPVDIHYLVRKKLERVRPVRGTVYVYGDDTSYYLNGRVFVDYEMGDQPMIWEFARQSGDTRRLRAKMRQRGISHILFSTRWPDTLGLDKKLAFKYDRRTLAVMQDFWARYSRPIITMENGDWLTGNDSYVFEIQSKPLSTPYNTDFSKYPPRLPGECGLTWEGDSAWNKGQPEEAYKYYSRMLVLFPESNLLRYRLAILENGFSRKKESLTRVMAMEKTGWISPKLRSKLAP
jgi:hypothetical protein